MLVAKNASVVVGLIFKEDVIPSSVAKTLTSTVSNITFVVNETTFKVALITSAMVKIIFVVTEIIFRLLTSVS